MNERMPESQSVKYISREELEKVVEENRARLAREAATAPASEVEIVDHEDSVGQGTTESDRPRTDAKTPGSLKNMLKNFFHNGREGEGTK